MTPLLPTATAQHRLIEDLTVIAAPVGATLRISFLSLEPTTGLSVITTLAMRELTRGRPERTLTVNAASDGRSPAPHSGHFLQPGVLERIPETTRARMRQQNGLTAVQSDDGVTGWNRVIAPVVKHFDVVGTCWGALPLEKATQAALTGTVTCVTGSYERESAETAIAFARALSEQVTDCRPLVVLSDLGDTRSTWPRLVAPKLPVSLIAVPHDPALKLGGAASARTLQHARSIAAALKLDPATREAHL